MFTISLCIEMIFAEEEEFVKRIERTAECGAEAFEFWGWQGKDLEAVTEARNRLGLELAAVAGGATLTDPDQQEQAVKSLRESIAATADLDCPNLIVTTGQEQEGLDREVQHKSIVKVLKEVAGTAEEKGVMLVLEPLNTAVNHQGYYLSSSYEGYEILDKVGSPSVRLLFDIYHQQITEGNVIENITSHIDYIGHFHLADVPGRHQPGTGELNYANIFSAIAETGYDRYVGCEFSPTGTSEEAVKEVLALV